MTKILIFGKNGQLSSQLISQLCDEHVAVGLDDLNLTNISALKEFLNGLDFKPKAIINAAAYTAVDKAEDKGKEINYLLNRDAPVEMAKYCKEKDIPFIYYTTDYVFDGKGDQPFKEEDTDRLGALGEYGKSKLEAEEEIAKIGGRYMIFRTSWVYNEVGKNFVATMIRLAKEKEELKIVNDQVGSPTYAKDSAQYTIEILEKALKMPEFPSGIYHLVNSGYTTWYDFANLIFDILREKGVELKIQKVHTTLTKDYPTPALRPLNSRLNLDKINRVFGVQPRHYIEALRECMEKML